MLLLNDNNVIYMYCLHSNDITCFTNASFSLCNVKSQFSKMLLLHMCLDVIW